MSCTVDPELDEEVDELYESLTGEWHDLPICVILIGKIESLLNQTIVADILSNSTKYNKYSKDIIHDSLIDILEKVTRTEDKDGRKYFNYKEDPLVKHIKHLIDVIAIVENSRFSNLIRGYVRTNAIMRDPSYSWFENEHCGKIAKNGLDLPLKATSAEAVIALKTQCRGLIHEVISVMTEFKYEKLRDNVPPPILERIGILKLKEHREIRNKVVHNRTSHRFLDDAEKRKFIETYADIVSCCVVEHDCFSLASNEENTKKKAEYMKPEAHFNLVQRMILDYKEAIKENVKKMEEAMDEDKRKIEEDTNEIRRQLNGAMTLYKDLSEEVTRAQEEVETSRKEAIKELESFLKDGNKESITRVVVALNDIGTIVGNIGREIKVVQQPDPDAAAAAAGAGDAGDIIDSSKDPRREASYEELEGPLLPTDESNEITEDAAQEAAGDEKLEGAEGEDTIDQPVVGSMSIPKAGRRKRQNQKEKEKKKQEKAAEEAAAATAVDATAVDATAVAEENSNVQPDEE